MMMFLILKKWLGLSKLRRGSGFTLDIIYSIRVKELECSSPGRYKRHPSPGWWSDCDRLSRDQAIALTIAMGVFKDKMRLFKFAIRNLFFTSNTRRNGATKENHGTDKYAGHPEDGQYNYDFKLPDFTGPKIWAIYIRGLGLWPLYPLLCIFDLVILGNVYSRKYTSDRDPLNHFLTLEYANRRMVTPAAWLADKLDDKVKLLRDSIYYFNRIDLMPMHQLLMKVVVK